MRFWLSLVGLVLAYLLVGAVVAGFALIRWGRRDNGRLRWDWSDNYVIGILSMISWPVFIPAWGLWKGLQFIMTVIADWNHRA